MTPPVTVVMITRDRRDATLSTLERLHALPGRPPVIVVDNGSSDGTADAVARRMPDVEVVALGRNLGAAGRNVGVERARTPYVAFADDDSWWEPGALMLAADVFNRHPRLGLLAARTLVGPDGEDDPLNAQLAAAPLGRQPDLPGPTVLGFLACAAVVRRAAFLEVGGFHAAFEVGGEESLLALDLAAKGWGLAYVPDVVARHDPEPQGERPGRRARQLRNDLWAAWLRHPAGLAARATARVARTAVADPAARSALVQAVRATPWVVRDRRPVPAPIADDLRRLAAR